MGLLVAVGVGWWLHGGGGDEPRSATRRAGIPMGTAQSGEPATVAATLSGRVLGAATGAPVAGAIVALAMDRQILIEGNAPLIAISDGAGRWTASDVPAGSYVVTATAAGYLPRVRELASDGSSQADIDLALEAGGTAVAGLIASEQHEPIAGAQVRAYREPGAPSFVARSGADGRYQLSLAPGAYQLEVTHADYRRTWQNVAVDDGPVSADIVLARGGEVRGYVIARDTNQPVPDAIVSGDGGGEASTTQVDGSFTLHGLDAGTITIHARARGYASVTPTTVELEAAAHVGDVRVLVDPAFSIVGRVVAQDDHARGIDGVAISAMGVHAAGTTMTTQSDRDGVFELVGMLPDKYLLSADRRGMLVETGVVIDVTDKDVTDTVIEMRSAVTLSGRVEPPMIAKIGFARAGGDLLADLSDKDAISIGKARTDSDSKGAFTLRDVPPGRFEVSALARDGRSGSALVTLGGRDQPTVVIHLSPRSSISGRVVDRTGAPVAGVDVFTNRSDAPFAVRARRDGLYRTGKSAVDGSFKIVGLEAGSWQLDAVDRNELYDAAKVEVELVDGRDRDGVTITVATRDAQLHGTVIGTDGKPASGVEVHALREVPEAAGFGYPSGTVRTDPSGSFTLDRLRRGTYTVTAEGPHGASKGSKSGVQTGDSVMIALASRSSLAVAVTRGGEPATKVSLICTGSANAVLQAELDGTHTFPEVAQGTYRCEATNPDGSVTASVRVGAEPATLALALGAYATVTGTAVNALSDQPVANIHVIARGTGAKTGADGRFVLEKVPAGADELVLMPQQVGAGVDKYPYAVKPGERVDVGRLKVVPARSGDAGTYGLTLEARGDAVVVTKVKAGSPAAVAGIAVGDAIAALDGQPVAAVGRDHVARFLASENVPIGAVAALTMTSGLRATITSIKW